jgi:hypothetical protein
MLRSVYAGCRAQGPFLLKLQTLENTDSAVLSLFRSTLILTFVSCYLMWGMLVVTCCPYPPIPVICVLHEIYSNILNIAIVFLSQWHPLIAPKRSDIRPDRVPQ